MDSPSIQLYTVREHLAANVDATLQRLASIGFTKVEPFGLDKFATQLAEPLKTWDLSVPTAHVKLLDADLEQIFTAAQSLGISTVIDPFIDPQRWTTREGVEGVANDLRQVALRATDHGLRVGYHNHAFEIENRIDGVAALEVFASSVGDSLDLELDTYWVEVGGESAAAMLNRFGDQVVAVHIKDGPKTKEDKDQVAVGNGSMPVHEILAAAPQALAVVELDDFTGDIFDAVEASYAFLSDTATRHDR